VSSLPLILEKAPTVNSALVDKLFQLFLQLRSLRIRRTLALGLATCSRFCVKPEVLDIVRDLNKLKRGAADLELDYDTVIKTIERIIEQQKEFQEALSSVEL
jgi:hypothetical protein